MQRRGIAVLLILSWVLLSAIDVLEDLQLHSSGESFVPGNGQPNSLVNKYRRISGSLPDSVVEAPSQVCSRAIYLRADGLSREP
jgi:hypothetical protein